MSRNHQRIAAVAQLFLAAVIVGGSVGVEAHADPDISPGVAAYAAHNADVICTVLDAYPSVDGVTGVLEAVIADGFTAYDAGEVVGIAVLGRCPEHIDAVQAFINRYGAGRELA